ncbi:MAG: PfkB family carbohydrate kinase [Gemmatimonadota bacterium]
MTVERFPDLWISGTLTLDSTEFGGAWRRDVPGGSALYGGAAARLLTPVRLVGTVGSDFPFPDLEDLWRSGVDPTAVETLEGPTFRWGARYEAGGDRRTTLHRDAGVSSGRLPPIPPSARRPRALLLASTHPGVQAHVRRELADASPVGLDSMAHWWREERDALLSLLETVHVAFFDEEELGLASGLDDPSRAGRWVLERGPHTVVVKRGSRGAWMHRSGREPVQVTAVPLGQIGDPTGAGDAFAGAFMAAQACAPTLGDGYSLRFATAAASFAAERIGIEGLRGATLQAAQTRMDALQVTNLNHPR